MAGDSLRPYEPGDSQSITDAYEGMVKACRAFSFDAAELWQDDPQLLCLAKFKHNQGTSTSNAIPSKLVSRMVSP